MRLRSLIKYVTILVLIIALSSCNFKANKEYKKAIESADAAFNGKKYKEAKTFYAKALDFKPEEKYPKDKMAEIDGIISKMQEEAYKKQIKSADDLLAAKKYTDAKSAYEKASKMKPKEAYPKTKINEINVILAELKKQEEYNKYPYHIVVGCFQVASNAERLNKKLLAEGHKSRIIKIANGRFDAVTVASFPTLKDSYNQLNKAKSEFTEEAWVMKK